MKYILSQIHVNNILRDKSQAHTMSWKYVPYAGFFLFTLLVSIVRLVLVPQLSFTVHLFWFAGQYCLLLLFWYVIRALAKYLDKKLPYSKSFSRRVFL